MRVPSATVSFVVAALATLVLVSGCGHNSAPTPMGSLSRTYTRPDFHFSIAYDPAQFKASPQPMLANGQLNLRLRHQQGRGGRRLRHGRGLRVDGAHRLVAS